MENSRFKGSLFDEIFLRNRIPGERLLPHDLSGMAGTGFSPGIFLIIHRPQKPVRIGSIHRRCEKYVTVERIPGLFFSLPDKNR